MNKVQELDELLYHLHRQFPDWPCTFNPCPSCGNSARGAGLCKHCITEEIGKIVGYPRAREYLFYMNQLASMRRSMYDIAEQLDKEEWCESDI